jgi:hypothetical protein
MAELNPVYERKFGVVPRLRAGVHADLSSSANAAIRSGKSRILATQ